MYCAYEAVLNNAVLEKNPSSLCRPVAQYVDSPTRPRITEHFLRLCLDQEVDGPSHCPSSKVASRSSSVSDDNWADCMVLWLDVSQ
jgi:hypothetical protein